MTTNKQYQALENCRLFASRHRKEDWAKTVLRFCAEGGATGSPLRAAAEPTQGTIPEGRRIESKVRASTLTDPEGAS